MPKIQKVRLKKKLTKEGRSGAEVLNIDEAWASLIMFPASARNIKEASLPVRPQAVGEDLHNLL